MTPDPAGFADPAREHFITVAAATGYTRRFRSTRPGAVPRAVLFPREVFDRLLAQSGCAGIRIYRGLAPSGEETMLLVSANAAGEDLLPGDPAGEGLVAEEGYPCPPLCSISSVLER